tara:strand:+ start:19525 stop:20022 length:498 start_codon:yes stop_codon:yes gene_type:complete
MLKFILSTLLITSCFTAKADDLMSPVTPVKPASDFTLETPAGENLSLSDFKGKFVLVNFWAYWCSPCIKEFPEMQALYDSSHKDLEIIGIHAGPYNEQAAEFVNKFGITFPIVSDPDTSLKGWDVRALPISYLIDPEGNITHRAIGAKSWDVDEMNALISESANF